MQSQKPIDHFFLFEFQEHIGNFSRTFFWTELKSFERVVLHGGCQLDVPKKRIELRLCGRQVGTSCV